MNTVEDGPPLRWIAEQLKTVSGVIGVVLGGSRARGIHEPDADYDLGVYYADDASLDLRGLNTVAQQLDDARRDTLLAAPGEWGAWVNGGAWLTVAGKRVDLILRDIRRVRQAIDDCQAGKVHAHYQTGHPHAYIDAMYAGELAIAKILLDPQQELRSLQQRMWPYPENLRRGLLQLFGFETGFSLMLAQAQLDKEDAYYVAAHLVRALSCLNQVLFAVNREYGLNEKKAVRMIEGFAQKPRDYRRRVDRVIASMGVDNRTACDELAALFNEARGLFAMT